MDALAKLLAPPDKYNRSAQANGRNWLRGLDKRTAEYRRLRDVMRGLLVDVPEPTERQVQIARRAATLILLCEAWDAKVVGGERINPVTYATAANTLRRLLLDLGLEQNEGFVRQYDNMNHEELKADMERRGLPTKIFED